MWEKISVENTYDLKNLAKILYFGKISESQFRYKTSAENFIF